ncbi:MAG: alpha/beta hydrolase [Actinomycetota bacterium]
MRLVTAGAIFAVLAVFGPALLRGPDEFETPRLTDARATLDVAYGDDDRQRFDVFIPAEGDGPFPAVIWIHGGGWRFGDKAVSMPVWDWTDDGYAVVAVNYRYAVDGVTIAGTTADVLDAVRAVFARADEYSIDPARVGVYGFSAGGHLTAMVGAAGFDVAALVVSGAPTDFEPLVDPGRSVFEARPSDEAAALIRSLLGCDDDCAESVTDVSPARLDAGDAPVLIVHGTDDTFVDVSQAEAYAARLEEDGVAHELVLVDGGGHAMHQSARIEAFFAEQLG